jgi:hypothetical protein
MVPWQKLFKSISLHIQKSNCEKCVYELKDHIGEKSLNLDLLQKI